MVVDETITMGGDRNKQATLNEKTGEVDNLEMGDAVVFYNTDEGYRYKSTDTLKAHLYRKVKNKDLTAADKEKTKIHSLEVHMGFYIKKSFVDVDKKEKIKYFKDKEGPIESEFSILLINKGNKPIKDFYIAIAPPEGIEIVKIEPEVGIQFNITSKERKQYTVTKKTGKNGKSYFLLHNDFLINPRDQYFKDSDHNFYRYIRFDCLIKFARDR